MIRILYLSPGPAPPPRKRPQENMFNHLSQYFCGDILAPLWGNKKDPHIINTIEEVNTTIGNFRYHVTFSTKLPNIIKIFWDISFYFLKGVYLHYFKKKYDVIFAYGPFTTGIAGYLLKKLTGAKLIIKIPGNPKKSFLFESKKPKSIDKLKSKISDISVPFILRRADHLLLLYKDQLNGYKNIKKTNISIFHDFVPISNIKPSEESEKYILFLGHPWFLKGVDILIKAFKLISEEFPEYHIKIVGFCPNKSYFKKLAEGNEKIELLDAISFDKAMNLMSRCTLFVLPSRTEGMGRVLLEAMASKKPIIASKVDGIPYYIKDGFNGLLFESENIEDLADKIRIILSNRNYATKLAENGYKYVHENLSEKCYVENFKKMIEKCLK